MACGGLRSAGLADAAEIKRMFVASGARGRGLGRRLLGELEAIARADGRRADPPAHHRHAPRGDARSTRSEGYAVRSSQPMDGGRTDFWLEKACCSVCRSMPEQLCTVDEGVELCYETFGDPPTRRCC